MKLHDASERIIQRNKEEFNLRIDGDENDKERKNEIRVKDEVSQSIGFIPLIHSVRLTTTAKYCRMQQEQ